MVWMVARRSEPFGRQAVAFSSHAATDDSPSGGHRSAGAGPLMSARRTALCVVPHPTRWAPPRSRHPLGAGRDRKSTRLNSSHSQISYAVFCLKKKKKNENLNTEPVSTRGHI